jgi:hypothetical protein
MRLIRNTQVVEIESMITEKSIMNGKRNKMERAASIMQAKVELY